MAQTNIVVRINTAALKMKVQGFYAIQKKNIHTKTLALVGQCGKKESLALDVPRVSADSENRAENWPWLASIGFFDHDGNWRH